MESEMQRWMKNDEKDTFKRCVLRLRPFKDRELPRGLGDLSPSRPSVVARKLRSECERSLKEKEIYMQALRDAETQVSLKREELTSTELEIQKVKQETKLLLEQKKELEARCEEIEVALSDRWPFLLA